MRIQLIVTMLALVVAGPMPSAALEAIPGLEALDALQEKNAGADGKNSLGAALGFGAIDEDFFLKLNLRSELNLGKVGVGFSIPLNLRVWDRDPKTPEGYDFGGVIRKEDWDEPAEFAKVIRYLRFGRKRDFIYARAGELANGIGHETIVGRYVNNLDLDTFHLGMAFDVNTDYGGIETIINDVPGLVVEGVDTKLVGARLYVKPWSFIDQEAFLSRVQLGFTLATDVNAPGALLDANSDGSFAVDEGVAVDEDGNPALSKTSRAMMMGFDIELNILDISVLSLTPYTDLNFSPGGGWGAHMGVMAVARLPLGFDLTLPARLEYRYFKGQYLPTYFDTFYDVERFNYPLGGNTTKLQHLNSDAADEGLHGFFGEAYFDFVGILQIGAIYEAYEGMDSSLAAFLNVPALDWLQFKAYYRRTGITGFDDIFKFDEKSLMVAQLRYEMFKYLYLVAQYSRRWQLDPNSGTYDTVNDWSFGVESSFSF